LNKKTVGININNIKRTDMLSFKFPLPFKNDKPDLEKQKKKKLNSLKNCKG